MSENKKEYTSLAEFYPTPAELIAKMVQKVGIKRICSAKLILEPSAGKGDIAIFLEMLRDKEDLYVGYLRNRKSIDEFYHHVLDRAVEAFKMNDFDSHFQKFDFLECIESDPILQAVLKGREIPVIDDDFLSFDGEQHFDFIIMNPPFSNGDEHLLHAIKLAEKTGSEIVCLLNANTIRNPYSNTRKMLLQKLSQYNATYDFIEHAFSTAERPSDVEIALVHVVVPSPFRTKSRIWEELETANIELEIPDECKDIVSSDTIAQAVLLYKREILAGKQLMEEYLALKPFLSSTFETAETPSYVRGMTTLTLSTGKNGELNFNQFVQSVRYKYWYELLHNPKFIGNLTSNLRDQYFSQIREFSYKEFSIRNIRKVKLDILKQTAQGIQDRILKLFDELSYRNSMGCEGNIHYFSGWKSNSAFKINEKVVVPYMQCWDDIWKQFKYNYTIASFLSDLEKTLDFLDGGETIHARDIIRRLTDYEGEQRTKNLEFAYFNVNVYKKGTIHIRFTNLDVLKKLNIYGCMRKGWLPPSYGQQSYADMSAEDKAIVDEFEGEKSYKETFEQKERFIVSAPENKFLLTV